MRFYIDLTSPEYDRLMLLAIRQRRATREQAAFIIAQAVRDVPLAPPDDDPPAERATRPNHVAELVGVAA